MSPSIPIISDKKDIHLFFEPVEANLGVLVHITLNLYVASNNLPTLNLPIFELFMDGECFRVVSGTNAQDQTKITPFLAELPENKKRGPISLEM